MARKSNRTSAHDRASAAQGTPTTTPGAVPQGQPVAVPQGPVPPPAGAAPAQAAVAPAQYGTMGVPVANGVPPPVVPMLFPNLAELKVLRPPVRGQEYAPQGIPILGRGPSQPFQPVGAIHVWPGVDPKTGLPMVIASDCMVGRGGPPGAFVRRFCSVQDHSFPPQFWRNNLLPNFLPNSDLSGLPARDHRHRRSNNKQHHPDSLSSQRTAARDGDAEEIRNVSGRSEPWCPRNPGGGRGG